MIDPSYHCPVCNHTLEFNNKTEAFQTDKSSVCRTYWTLHCRYCNMDYGIGRTKLNAILDFDEKKTNILAAENILS